MYKTHEQNFVSFGHFVLDLCHYHCFLSQIPQNQSQYQTHLFFNLGQSLVYENGHSTKCSHFLQFQTHQYDIFVEHKSQLK